MNLKKKFQKKWENIYLAVESARTRTTLLCYVGNQIMDPLAEYLNCWGFVLITTSLCLTSRCCKSCAEVSLHSNERSSADLCSPFITNHSEGRLNTTKYCPIIKCILSSNENYFKWLPFFDGEIAFFRRNHNVGSFSWCQNCQWYSSLLEE